ncbi:MFS transporter [Siphonobacter sp. SORGH_AS_1065]|uniref:MFS transporter n=1 Tax=Siphonobacter sp. SORGH_AS_1065 TaxID=3041795 RepID=UPI00278534AE|nr:MFS transporter [Siphonobacter sp. SORGH_AS_1065]MDQ1089471.1 MFS family permease [Siphonobacter sp. SORGH_AS_1065]
MQSKTSPLITSKKRLWEVIFASSAGTVIEWYDFYIFGSLAAIISTKFFPPENPAAAFLSTLATHGAGFVARPFGAIVFGRLGDMIGRKYTFLVTLMLMGGSTFAIAFIPQYASIGILAPIILLVLRVLQGLALGGEYGGAATYVAEHSPDNQRGKFTSYIQTTASIGFFISIIVILGCQFTLGKSVFNEWGWRLPFALSGFLVVLSYFIRRNMDESPAFAKLKKEGNITKTPLRDAFKSKANVRLMLIAMFGAIIGQGAIWHTSQFYAQIFITKILNVEYSSAQTVMAVAVTCATPFFVIFGTLSDRIGRKKVMMAGLLGASLFLYPLYKGLDHAVNSGTILETKITPEAQVSTYTDGKKLTQTYLKLPNGKTEIKTEIILPTTTLFIVGLLVFIQVLFATMAYGPIAAFLVELFPTKIRYTSLSIPYNVANGIFGGCSPFVATWLGSLTGSKFAGLYYPILLTSISFIVGMIFIKETAGSKLEDE